jgi:Glycine-rich domain-containing protein-like
MTGTGYGDRDLSHICHKCGGEINQDLLRIAKFKKDSENLIMRDWPLGGTILSTKTGGPDGPVMSEVSSYFNTFPNRLISIALRSKVLELTNLNYYRSPTMLDVRDLIENSIKDKNIVKKVNSKTAFESGALRREERLAVRKMMSRYWENPSVFALELGGAVIRQSVFVDKMYTLDWLHSPAAKETMKRLLVKYQRFVQIMATYPLHVAVPTLDVDLGWHTHQLSPKSYYDYTFDKCKKFIDHDDKMDEDQLNTGFEWTSKTYQKLFQGVYSECTCWYCEGNSPCPLRMWLLLTPPAIRSKHISSAGRIFGTSTHEKVADKFHDSGAAKLCPPDNSAHISAHSAVKALESSTRAVVYDRMRARRQQELDTAYEKACKRAKSKGRPVPSRDAYYYGPWGYPYMMYGPWMAYGYYPGIYAYGDPYCMPMGVGMAGACAAGTCSGGVAAGGCGGAGGCGTGGGCVSLLFILLF